MAIIVEFPRAKVSRVVKINAAADPSSVTFLPVVRIERPAKPRQFRGGKRADRKRVMEKLRELQLELGRSL